MFGRSNLQEKKYLICELVLINLRKINKIIELMPNSNPKKIGFINDKQIMEDYLLNEDFSQV
jgi:hypothetical protein